MLNASVLLLVLLPVIIGIVLSSLAGAILRLHQGARSPLGRWLFRPWLKRNQKRSRERYGSLEAKRREYLFSLLRASGSSLWMVLSAACRFRESEASELIGQLKAEIQTLHENWNRSRVSASCP